MSKISRNIKKLRSTSGMTQEELAAKIHVTRQTVSSWETDRTQPDLQMLQSIAEVFSIEPEEIIYGKRRNAAEEKEKLLFTNALVTVLSVLGCLLIGAGIVMIFVKFWQDFPDILKLLTCFIPALLGQGFGIYTYIKKKESQAWCEGASVLWMLGVGVTTGVIISLTSNSAFVNYPLVYLFLAAGYFILMAVFKSLSPLPVVHTLSIMWFVNSLDDNAYYYLDLEDGAGEIFRFIAFVLIGALFIFFVIYTSEKLFIKEESPIRRTFSSWINLASVIAFTGFALARTEIGEAFISLTVLTSILFFAIGQKEKNNTSPYRVLGLPVSAAAMCFFSIISGLDSDVGKWVSVLILIISLAPFVLLTHKKTKPESLYLKLYGILSTTALTVFNILNVIHAFRSPLYYEEEYLGFFKAYDFFFDAFMSINFPICLASLIMLIIYGARERKLIYLNLGFILSCVSVIAKLYLLDLGLIVTGIMLIVCGVALLFVNLKISKLREKEKSALTEAGEEEPQ